MVQGELRYCRLYSGGYGLNNQDFKSWYRKQMFLFSEKSRLALRPTELLVDELMGTFLTGKAASS
jgi:hypothetical protein